MNDNDSRGYQGDMDTDNHSYIKDMEEVDYNGRSQPTGHSGLTFTEWNAETISGILKQDAFTGLIVGSSMSGKSYLTHELLHKIAPYFSRGRGSDPSIVLISATWNISGELRKRDFQGFDKRDVMLFDKDKVNALIGRWEKDAKDAMKRGQDPEKKLIVWDDVINEDMKKLTPIITAVATIKRHYFISQLILTQSNSRGSGLNSIKMRANLSFIMCGRLNRAGDKKLVLEEYINSFIPQTHRGLNELILKELTDEKYSFAVFDLTIHAKDIKSIAYHYMAGATPPKYKLRDIVDTKKAPVASAPSSNQPKNAMERIANHRANKK